MNDRLKKDELLASAVELWEKRNLRGAIPLFLKAANLGDSTAQHNLAFFFDVGRGTTKNRRRAFYWYKRAWISGKQADTCSNIAKMYAEKGLHKNAIRWWDKAIRRGDGDAALELARYLYARRDRRFNAKVPKLLERASRSKNITPDGRKKALKLLAQYDRCLT